MAFCNEWGEPCPYGLDHPTQKTCCICWEKRLKGKRDPPSTRAASKALPTHTLIQRDLHYP